MLYHVEIRLQKLCEKDSTFYDALATFMNIKLAQIKSQMELHIYDFSYKIYVHACVQVYTHIYVNMHFFLLMHVYKFVCICA